MKKFGVAVLLAASAIAAHTPTADPKAGVNIDQDSKAELSARVRQAINKLPYYGVYDDLNYSIDDHGGVTISGEARTYVVRNSAISAVKGIPGVTRVEDKIEVLPLSPYDDSIRIRTYDAIFGFPALSRYAINSRSPIRIIVDRGNVTLEGVVNNELDRKLIDTRVRAVAGVFSLKNNLRLDSDTEQSKS